MAGSSTVADDSGVTGPRDVCHLTLGCDALTVQGTGLRLITYSAESASADREALALLGVLDPTGI